MLRRTLAALATVLFVMLATVAFATDRQCPPSITLSPASGTSIGGAAPMLRWSGEPVGTATREVVFVGVQADQAGNVLPTADGRRDSSRPFHHLPRKLTQGTYDWFIVFRDQSGAVICVTDVVRLSVGRTTEPAETFSSVTVALKGDYVIVLFDSPYLATSGKYDLLISADDLDASSLKLAGYSTITIHGNDRANVLTGTGLNDIIYGYAGNDTLNGLDGDDTLYGGDESCAGEECNFNQRLGDTLNGGQGSDTLYGGDESCAGQGCNALGMLGDTLNGNDGDDTVYGGDESCSGHTCNDFGEIGDSLDGGGDNDTLHGGYESCSGVACNSHGDVGDSLEGGGGNDALYGGDESCSGFSCNNFGEIGDSLAGGADNDTLYGGDESCGGANVCNNFGQLGDSLDGGEGSDALYGGDESCSAFICNNFGNIGDTLDGGDGDDTGSGGTESDNGSANSTVGDTIVPDAGDTTPITQN